jgi:Ca2+-transporting ATPase
MIIGQAIFQVVATFVLHFAGPQFLPYPEKEMRSLIFNMFVWLQIFNQYNNRRLDNSLNIFINIHRNYYFIGLNFIMVGCQIAIVFFGSTAFSITALNGPQWAISVVVAVLCIPWGVCVRLFPDRWFEVGAKFLGRPFVLVYRPMARITDRVVEKCKPKRWQKKKSKGEKDTASNDSGSYIGNGKSPAETIRVSSDPEKGVM